MADTDVATNWFEALGKPLPPTGRQAAHDLLVAEGCDSGEAGVVVMLVAREIEHDNPEQAQKILRNWLSPYGNETFVLRTLATLCVGVRNGPAESPTE